MPAFCSLCRARRVIFFFLFFPSLGIFVERNEGFLLLKGEETKLTLCISRNDSNEVDLPQQEGPLWSEGITERALRYFLWSRQICLLPSGWLILSSLIFALKLIVAKSQLSVQMRVWNTWPVESREPRFHYTWLWREAFVYDPVEGMSSGDGLPLKPRWAPLPACLHC